MDKIEEIVVKVAGNEKILSCKDFFEEKMLDSLQLMEIVTALEDNFHIEIDGDDIIPDNLCNTKVIKTLVAKYVNGETDE